MEKSLQRCVLLVTLSLFFFISIAVSLSVPFVFFHGIGGGCSDDQMRNLTKLLNNYSTGSCVEIGNGKQDSVFMPLTQQASIACEKIKQMPELSDGYNIVGVSQGNLVARGLIEFCDNAPPVFNYVSLGGPHAGVAAIPEWCNVSSLFVCVCQPCTITFFFTITITITTTMRFLCLQNWFCKILKAFFSQVYDDHVQGFIAPSNFVKIPTKITEYLEHSKYLPKLNNERPGEKNSTYKERFTSLHNLVLIMFEKDDVLIPKESSWFGYYPDGDNTTILPPRKTKLYTEDWIGLKTLDAAGKLKFVSLPGAHIQITDDEVVEYVVPYLQNEYTLSSEHEAM
ncbi:PREDICTED: palmitoyl-protein thioesterase 3-like isoform X1 [Camelina sativa]|uniref:Palmitoyl-protein thioesterase 3-like isoform X1 n=1 Tax=Camelina sativa TaxID=90675 RepID=A0ABM0UEJ2_CAMSA|nr:PREDICTED: palmitoyl-protein thioesterase 3-like isoform X1 [Camelina sativa]